MKAPYCPECSLSESQGPSRSLGRRHRVARAVAGVALLALGWPLLAVAHPWVAWPLAALAGWLGVSHLVAAWTAYPDCPELGAVVSLLRRRYVATRCGPWERVDRWLGPSEGKALP